METGLKRCGGLNTRGEVSNKSIWRGRVIDTLSQFTKPMSGKEIYEFILVKYAFKDNKNRYLSVISALSVLNKKNKLEISFDHRRKHIPTLYKLREV